MRVGQVEGPEVGRVVYKGPAGHAAAAGARGHVDALGVEVGVAAVGDVLAVGTHAVLVAVEEGRVLGCVRVEGEVPVGKSARVSAQVLQVLFVVPDEVTVPDEEVGGDVNVHRHVNMSCDVFVVTVLQCF